MVNWRPTTGGEQRFEGSIFPEMCLGFAGTRTHDPLWPYRLRIVG
jgi:hypothetical protein